jgi:hypothetical protein
MSLSSLRLLARSMSTLAYSAPASPPLVSASVPSAVVTEEEALRGGGGGGGRAEELEERVGVGAGEA